MKNRTITIMVATVLLFGVWLAAVALAKSSTARDLDQILDYTLFGVSLNTSMETAKTILTDQGFTLKGEPYPDQISWAYGKENVTIVIEKGHKGAGLRTIGVTENATGGHFDLQPRIAEIHRSWGASADGKPVCQTRALKGKIVLGECGVSDPEDQKAAYYAMLSIVQIQQRLGRLAADWLASRPSITLSVASIQPQSHPDARVDRRS